MSRGVLKIVELTLRKKKFCCEHLNIREISVKIRKVWEISENSKKVIEAIKISAGHHLQIAPRTAISIKRNQHSEVRLLIFFYLYKENFRNKENSIKLLELLMGWELLCRRCLRLLPVVVEVFQVLLHSVDGLVSVVDPLVVLVGVDVRWERVGEVRGNVARCVLAEKALQKLFDEVPAENGHQARPVVDLDEDSFEVLVLTHRDAAQFDEEVAKFKSRAF